MTDRRPKSFGAVPQYGHVEVVEVVDVVVVIIGGGSGTGTGKAGCGGGLVVVMFNCDLIQNLLSNDFYSSFSLIAKFLNFQFFFFHKLRSGTNQILELMQK